LKEVLDKLELRDVMWVEGIHATQLDEDSGRRADTMKKRVQVSIADSHKARTRLCAPQLREGSSVTEERTIGEEPFSHLFSQCFVSCTLPLFLSIILLR
jgi:hypothetical protein